MLLLSSYIYPRPYISLSSLHNVYFCSDSRHVRSDALLAARIQKLPEKFSGKIDIAQEAVKIRRGNIAAAKFVRLAIKWLYSWLYSFIYIPDFIHK